MSTPERIAWSAAGALLLALVLLLADCAAVEKALTAENAGRLREATREACREIAAADRAAGAFLDDAGAP